MQPDTIVFLTNWVPHSLELELTFALTLMHQKRCRCFKQRNEQNESHNTIRRNSIQRRPNRMLAFDDVEKRKVGISPSHSVAQAMFQANRHRNARHTGSKRFEAFARSLSA